MFTAGPAHRAWKFGEFTLDLDRGGLVRAGIDVPLRPRPYAVLSYLVERQGRLVAKDELLDAVWGHRAVTDGAVTQSLIEIRRALGDEDHRIIRTVPRRGYLFEPRVMESAEPRDATADALAADPGAAPPVRAQSRLAPWQMAWRPALALGVTLAVLGLWWGATDRGEGGVGLAVATGLPTSGPSIAVLPFVDLSPEQDQAWFSDGLAEEILNLLTRAPGLHVTARTSSFSFKGQNPDIATIAEKLNVNHILEGSVRKWGNRVRITAQLVEVAGSSHLWSETYERELDDLFAIQDEIAGSVVQSLQLTLAGMEPPRLGGTGNPKAYEDYLHARFLFNRRSPGDLPRAQHYYRQAVEADPDFGRAWAGLAGALQVGIFESSRPSEGSLTDWQTAVERALALAPELPESQFRAAMYFRMTGQADRGKEHLKRALAGELDDPHGLVVAAGDAFDRGQYETAIDLQRRALALDPAAAAYHYNLAVYLSFAGRYEEADAELRRTQELSAGASGWLESELPFFMIVQGRYAKALAIIEAWPDGEDRDIVLVLAYRGLQRYEEANAAFNRLIGRPGDRAAVHVAEAFAQSGNVDESFRWLDTARSRFDPAAHPVTRRVWVATTRGSSWLYPLRADPRWTTWGHD